MNTRIYCITRDRNDYTAYLDISELEAWSE